MNEEEVEKLTLALTGALIRITVLERILINKKIITGEEISQEMLNVTKVISKTLLENAKLAGNDKIPDNLDDILSNFEK
jgi:hypothetical protein